MGIADERKYRHEFKYMISPAQLAVIKQRMEKLVSLDKHVADTGSYNIRSMYFDDYDNHCYYENENGVDPREKFRIRIYNHSSNRISLEKKRKERDKTLKTSCPLTLEQTKCLIAGRCPPELINQPPLLRELSAKIMLYRYHPVVIVEYNRIPYVYKNGNVRITLDMEISSSSAFDKFFEENIPKRPIFPKEGQLLEVKYDEYLPDFIYQTLQLDSLQRTSCSKFYLCRKFQIK